MHPQERQLRHKFIVYFPAELQKRTGFQFTASGERMHAIKADDSECGPVLNPERYRYHSTRFAAKPENIFFVHTPGILPAPDVTDLVRSKIRETGRDLNFPAYKCPAACAGPRRVKIIERESAAGLGKHLLDGRFLHILITVLIPEQ